jgi:hypothetical protein
MGALLVAILAHAQRVGTQVVSCLTPDSVQVRIWLVESTTSSAKQPKLVFSATNRSRKPQRILLGAAGGIGGVEGLSVEINQQKSKQRLQVEHMCRIRGTLWTAEMLEKLKSTLRSGETRKVSFALSDVVYLRNNKQLGIPEGTHLPPGSYQLRFDYLNKGYWDLDITKPFPVPGVPIYCRFQPLKLIVQP